ncbi:MAG TPA: hypothetical protein VK747_13180 [Blastocatellia bacterium]|nr:hypothetical protein [Blastocatellia bacterium]
MMPTKTFRKSSSVLIIAVVFICALILSIGATGKRGDGPRKVGTPETQSTTPRVQNKTRSFELTHVKDNRAVDDGGPTLWLRNGYDKNITACAVSINGLIGQIDFVYSDVQDQSGIAPGAVYTRRFSYVHYVNPTVAARQGLDINVLAVVFDDRSGDGDEKAVAAILDERQKSKLRLTRIVDLLNEDLSSARTINDTVFDELKSRISSFATGPEDSSEINDVLQWLGEPDRLGHREKIVRVKETCESLVARL